MFESVRRVWRRTFRQLWKWTSPHPLLSDTALAGAVFLVAMASTSVQIEFFSNGDPTYEPPSKLAQLAGLAMIIAPLAFRRRTPLLALATCTAGIIVSRVFLEWSLEPTVTALAFSIAVFSAAAHGRRLWRNVVCGLSVLIVLIEIWTELERVYGPDFPNPALLEAIALLVYVALFSAMWALGVALGANRRRSAELLERTRALESQREENARRAVFDERVRIAREMHDVVAHHVSVMGVQATAARLVMGRDPEKAATALSSIETSSRQAVTELHRLLGFLRQEGDDDDRASRPGLGQLRDLVDSVAGPDLAVEVSIEGVPRDLSQTVDVSVYRIVQEALTNTLKHAHASRACVRLCYRPEELQVDVLDNGRGPVTAVPNERMGHGLTGMKERASLLGGELAAGPVANGGFLVRVTLPTPGGAL